MKDGLYQFLVGVLDLFLWCGELIGEENLPRRGPAVFIANHLDATGPIATACSIPMRVHPWVIADMMDKGLAPLWLQADFVERQLHFKPPVSRWVARALCRISVPLFYSLGCIPVYRGDYERMHATLEISMGVLREGKSVLVFPEDNCLPTDPVTKMQPFQHSFARLGEMYYTETGERMGFYPVVVHSTGQLVVGKPVVFNPLNSVGLERRRLKELMEDTIPAVYMQLEGGNATGALMVERM
ncbi:MAG: 1-acyl-sn-glycerol-3-phosphate acyltransferase [Chloroflexi bacterium]|nr:1-acyl-sn-glycerol-3-phosphate acyltransferase [Chloroflexota bacterium]